ncbi:MAG: response regulator transcription factor [Phycisphaerales bacterium]
MSRCRVVIVDDHTMVLSAIAGVIDSDGRFEVVGQCTDADEATTLALREQPDIVVMDIDMPGVSCFDAARTITSHLPDTRIVFLTAHAHDHHIERAMELGASAFITKHETPERVIEALSRVAGGGTYFSSEVQTRIVLTERQGSRSQRHTTRLSTLSPREQEVLLHIASGMTKKQIAELMHLSPKTVDNHSTNLMDKLDIHDRVELTKFAIREGLVTP